MFLPAGRLTFLIVLLICGAGLKNTLSLFEFTLHFQKMLLLLLLLFLSVAATNRCGFAVNEGFGMNKLYMIPESGLPSQRKRQIAGVILKPSALLTSACQCAQQVKDIFITT